MKLAYFSPLSPIRSGISAYTEELLPYLAEWAEIDLFVDDYVPTHLATAERFPVYSRLAYAANRWTYDGAIYHLGNHQCHLGIYLTFLECPGIVVLHDFNLYGLIGSTALEQKNWAGFVREMGYAEGIQGRQRGWRIVRGYVSVNPRNHPLNRRILDQSLGIVVHSEYARRSIQRISPEVRVTKIEMGVALPPPLSEERRAKARRNLNLPIKVLLISSFGLVTPEKRIDTVLKAFRELLRTYPDARYVLVGEVTPGNAPMTTIRELGLEKHVEITGFLPFEKYQDYMAACDIAVNLRYPTAGETSASVLRLLAAGIPTVVSDVGWFAELPDNCCLKIEPDEGEERRLATQLVELAGSEAVRRQIGEQAREYVKCKHSLAGASQAYRSFVHSVLRDLGQF